MYQEGVLPLAQVYAYPLSGNRWYGEPRVRELAIAALRFAARSSHWDGSCDDYYPFERALGAAVFSLQAATKAYQLLALDDPDLRAWFERRAQWLMAHDETGRLANHQALAALALHRVAEITGQEVYRAAAENRLQRLLSWQSPEGWFDEYGGADPGYQTVTIDCLAAYRRATGVAWLDEPLRRGVRFAALFAHPDGSYGGEYGSRSTYHFYPHGMELLAAEDADAADLADNFLKGLSSGRHGYFDDDRLVAHRVGNSIDAYRDWSPRRPPSTGSTRRGTRYLADAKLLVRRTPAQHTIISAARGGVFKHFVGRQRPVTDAGLIVEFSDGRTAVSQRHDRDQRVEIANGSNGDGAEPVKSLQVARQLDWVRFETATPLKQAIFHVGMITVGRWCRSLIRAALQRRLITGGTEAPLRLRRRFEFDTAQGDALRVIDQIELLDRRRKVRRMSFGTDHQTAYVAASNIYQDAVLAPWHDLTSYVEALNRDGQVTIVRQL